jgi:glucose/arabinose dehydrogenase
VAGVLSFIAGSATPAAAASFPSGFTDTLVAGSLGSPTALAQLPDGRFLVTTQGGQLDVISGSSATVALDLTASNPMVCSAGEEGLLGVTVDPQFSTNQFIYLYYTRQSHNSCGVPGNASGGAVNGVSRLTLNGNTASRSSEKVLLDNMPTWGTNHNGGYVHVAHDGTLFVSVGDGGGSRPPTNPSDLGVPNGKILRINRDGSIPAGNPHGTHVCGTTWKVLGPVCGEIYADGLRNPFRLAFKDDAPGVTFRINDVGDATWEEVDEGIVGAHYGWPCREGPAPHGNSAPCTMPFTNPVLWYNHSIGCDVMTGGAFVPAGTWRGYDNDYLFGDFECGRIFVAKPGTTGSSSPVLATGAVGLTDMAFFKQNGAYALFYVTYGDGGQLRKVVGPPPVPPPTTVSNLKFSAVQPTRVLDTRNGTGVAAGKLEAGQAITLKVTGGVVPASARAVALNLTATLPSGPGFVTAWPTGASMPGTSSVDLSQANETAANAVIVPIGQGGQINLFTFGSTHLVADVTGYFSPGLGSPGGRYMVAPTPTRLLDTRNGTGGKLGPFVGGDQFDLAVAGHGGVPASATAVALTVTYTEDATSGFITVWPTGSPRPLASTTNPNGGGDIRSNLALVPIGTGGKVSLFSSNGTHLVVDVVGWFTNGSGPHGLFTSVSPVRVADSRLAGAPFPRIAGGTEATMNFSTLVPGGSSAVLYNLTATNTVAGGFLTAHPGGTPVPNASSVNWSGPSQHRAALTVSSLKSAGRVGLYAFSSVDGIIDLSGYFRG